MTTPRLRCALCSRLVMPLPGDRYPVHGPNAERCAASGREVVEVRYAARRRTSHSKRYDWSRMHARGSARLGWKYKPCYATLGEAWQAAREVNGERDSAYGFLRPYPCNWTDAPPPDAAREERQHYHIGRTSVDAPTQRG